MKVFTCTNFKGHWPVGVAAIVIAENRKQARRLLSSELRKRGLKLGGTTLTEVSTTEPAAFILADGNY